MRGPLLAVGVLVALTSTASAQATLQNDGFTSGQAVGFQAGFVSGEMGASRFLAPAAVQQLLRVEFLFGGAATTQTITLNVYDDTAGTLAPGANLFTGDFQVTGDNMSMQQVDLTGNNVMVTQQFRVAIQFQHNGLPSIARDDDGNINASRNFIFASGGFGWQQSSTFGLTGDWIIRAVVSTAGPTPDAAMPLPDADPSVPDADPVAPDAPPSGGDCQGNTDCPVGQFCDTASMTCTFECREDTDCGGGDVCNSLGQCVEGEGGGGCCRTDRGGGPAAVLFGLGVMALLVRRRRR